MPTAVCIASGSSLTQEDVDYCKGKAKIYVVNDVYKLAPWADVLYACDFEWWHHHKGAPEFQGEKWTANRNASYNFLLNHIEVNHKAVFSTRQGVLASGGNSGFQALNLAVLQGADEVILLGYDMQLGVQGKRHFFGNHPGGMNKKSDYTKWIKHFEMAKSKIPAKIINCTPYTALNCFKKAKLRDIL